MIEVCPEILKINFTKDYIKEFDSSLTNTQAKKVLKWLGDTYDENVGINRSVIYRIIQGVQSGLL